MGRNDFGVFVGDVPLLVFQIRQVTEQVEDFSSLAKRCEDIVVNGQAAGSWRMNNGRDGNVREKELKDKIHQDELPMPSYLALGAKILKWREWEAKLDGTGILMREFRLCFHFYFRLL